MDCIFCFYSVKTYGEMKDDLIALINKFFEECKEIIINDNDDSGIYISVDYFSFYLEIKEREFYEDMETDWEVVVEYYNLKVNQGIRFEIFSQSFENKIFFERFILFLNNFIEGTKKDVAFMINDTDHLIFMKRDGEIIFNKEIDYYKTFSKEFDLLT